VRRRSRPALVLAGIVLSVALVACGSDDGDSGDGGGSAGASTDPAELVGPTWTLDEATRGAMAQDADQVDADVTLQFAEDGTVSGSSACNTYSGPYEAQDDGSITLGPLASTQMACDEAIMALEANYLQTLDQASSFAIAEGQLILQAMNVQLAYDA
jgi:heat shock protein HslJ